MFHRTYDIDVIAAIEKSFYTVAVQFNFGHIESICTKPLAE